jgi:positive phototaxis protein PixI
MQTATPLGRVQTLLPQLFQVEQVNGEAVLKCALTEDISALLTLEQVQVALVVPVQQITAMPNLPEWGVGLMHAQGQVFMVIDLPQVLGLPMVTATSQQYHIVVVRGRCNQQDISVGLIVNRIHGLLQVQAEDILSPGNEFLPQFQPYLQGRLFWEDKQLMVLDVDAIVTSLTRYAP